MKATYRSLKKKRSKPGELVTNAADVALAVNVMTHSRDTHRQWIDFFAAHPDKEAELGKIVGNSAHHQQIIDRYNHVLRVLQGQRPAMTPLEWFSESLATFNGGAGSGDYGHSGRPGEVGGSGDGGGATGERGQVGPNAHRPVPDRFQSGIHPMPVGSKVTARKFLHVGGTTDSSGTYKPLKQFAASQDSLEVVDHRGGEHSPGPAQVLVRHPKTGETAWISRSDLRGKTTGRGHRIPAPTGQEEPYNRPAQPAENVENDATYSAADDFPPGSLLMPAKRPLFVGGGIVDGGAWKQPMMWARPGEPLEVLQHRGGSAGLPWQIQVRNRSGAELWVPRSQVRGYTPTKRPT